MNAPYKAQDCDGYWILIDTRTGEPASFPTSKAKCQAEAKLMNAAYREAVAS